MRIYKPSVITIRVTISHGEDKVKFTVLESELDELLTLVLNEFKGFTERPVGRRIADGVKVIIRKLNRAVNLGERTVNVYGVPIDLVAERLVYSINMVERESILEKANNIMKGII